MNVAELVAALAAPTEEPQPVIRLDQLAGTKPLPKPRAPQQPTPDMEIWLKSEYARLRATCDLMAEIIARWESFKSAPASLASAKGLPAAAMGGRDGPAPLAGAAGDSQRRPGPKRGAGVRQMEIMRFLAEHPDGASTYECARLVALDSAQVGRCLRGLEKAGRARRDGEGRWFAA